VLRVYERINIGGYLLWMAVLAVAILRTDAGSGSGKAARPPAVDV
jgi:hypothetical protein